MTGVVPHSHEREEGPLKIPVASLLKQSGGGRGVVDWVVL